MILCTVLFFFILRSISETIPPVFNIDCCPAITNDQSRPFLTGKIHEIQVSPAFIQSYPVPLHADTNEFVAEDNFFDYLMTMDTPFDARFQPDEETIKKYEREVYELAFFKLGTEGNAPMRVYVKYTVTSDEDEETGLIFQNDLAIEAWANDQCAFGGNNVVYRGTGIDSVSLNAPFREDPFSRTYDGVALIDECIGNDATNCAGDIHTWSNRISLSLNPNPSSSEQALFPSLSAWPSYGGIFLNAEGGLSALNAPLCREMNRFFTDFCDYFGGSDVRVVFGKQRQRYSEILSDLYTKSNFKESYGQAKIEMVTRYDVTNSEENWIARLMPDEPGPIIRISLKEFWLKIYEIPTGSWPSYLDTQKIVGGIVDWINLNANPYVDRRAC